MPTKKTTTAKKTVAKKVEAKKAAPAKKTVAKEETTKTVAKKAAVAKAVKAEAKPAVKEVVKKAAKPVEKKAPAKKAATKKPATKKAAVAKLSVQDYCDKINWKKGEAQYAGNLYMEIAASDLLNEFENGVSNLTTVKKAVKECLLIGDEILSNTKTDLIVRYYVDNLSPEREKYSA